MNASPSDRDLSKTLSGNRSRIGTSIDTTTLTVRLPARLHAAAERSGASDGCHSSKSEALREPLIDAYWELRHTSDEADLSLADSHPVHTHTQSVGAACDTRVTFRVPRWLDAVLDALVSAGIVSSKSQAVRLPIAAAFDTATADVDADGNADTRTQGPADDGVRTRRETGSDAHSDGDVGPATGCSGGDADADAGCDADAGSHSQTTSDRMAGERR